MKNELITLITTIKERNQRGFEEVKELHSNEIFASVRSAGVIEKYEAERAGINISIIFVVDIDSYKESLEGKIKPDKVEYDEEIYTIHDVRKRKGTSRELEIVCKR